MNVIKILAIILAAAILGALGWAITLPANVHIEKKVEINAPIEIVFKQVNNFHNWKNWAPYQDSILHTKFEGSREGVGSIMLWTDEKEGRGKNEIIESIVNEKVVTVLSFNKNNEARSIFVFEKIGSENSMISWSMDINDLSYPFGRFVGYMIRKGAEYNFNKALNKLKTFVEERKNIPDYKGYDIIDNNLDAKIFISSVDSSTMVEMKIKIGDNFKIISEKLKKADITPISYPIVEWNTYNPEGISQFRCLMPIEDSKKARKFEAFYEIPAGRTVWVKYIGPYNKSAVAWNLLDKYLKDNNLEMNGSPYEEYVTDPSTVPDANKWITNIYFPVKDK